MKLTLPQDMKLVVAAAPQTTNAAVTGDYISLKNNKTKDLDLITNGLESWVNGSGPAMGRFVAKIIDGTQADYEEILKAAQFEENWGHAYDWGDDALRVIDGELDNQYNATTTPIAVRQ